MAPTATRSRTSARASGVSSALAASGRAPADRAGLLIQADRLRDGDEDAQSWAEAIYVALCMDLDPATALGVHRCRWLCRRPLGRREDLAEFYESVALHATDPCLRREASVLLAQVAAVSGNVDDGWQVFRGVYEGAQGTRDRSEMLAAHACGAVAAMRGRWTEALASLRVAGDVARELGEVRHEMQARILTCETLAAMRDWPRYEEEFAIVHAQCGAAETPAARSALSALARCAAEAGIAQRRWHHALAACEVLDECVRTECADAARTAKLTGRIRGAAFAALGNHEDALAELEQVADAPGASTAALLRAAAFVRTLGEQGQRDEALAAAAGAMQAVLDDPAAAETDHGLVDAMESLARTASEAHPRSGAVRGVWGLACAFALRLARRADLERETRATWIRVTEDDHRTVQRHAEWALRRCSEVFRTAGECLESRPYGTRSMAVDRDLTACPWCMRVRQPGVVWLPAGLFVRRRPEQDLRSLVVSPCPDCAAEFKRV